MEQAQKSFKPNTKIEYPLYGLYISMMIVSFYWRELFPFTYLVPAGIFLIRSFQTFQLNNKKKMYGFLIVSHYFFYWRIRRQAIRILMKEPHKEARRNCPRQLLRASF